MAPSERRIWGAAFGVLVLLSLITGYAVLRPVPQPVIAIPVAPAPTVLAVGYCSLPELLVNLDMAGRRPSFLKMSVSIEIDDSREIPNCPKYWPQVIDSMQAFLRQLRPEDLKGSAGLFKLREEMLRRIREAAPGLGIRDVLFNEVLLQ